VVAPVVPLAMLPTGSQEMSYRHRDVTVRSTWDDSKNWYGKPFVFLFLVFFVFSRRFFMVVVVSHCSMDEAFYRAIV
jgi:hypothetical protein